MAEFSASAFEWLTGGLAAVYETTLATLLPAAAALLPSSALASLAATPLLQLPAGVVQAARLFEDVPGLRAEPVHMEWVAPGCLLSWLAGWSFWAARIRTARRGDAAPAPRKEAAAGSTAARPRSPSPAAVALGLTPALWLCATAHPLHARFANIFGTSLSHCLKRQCDRNL